METKDQGIDFTPYTQGGNWPPVPPTGRMPLEQRAKIFIPFDPLKGFQAALRKKELEIEEEDGSIKGAPRAQEEQD